jgi:hypothetical protein
LQSFAANNFQDLAHKFSKYSWNNEEKKRLSDFLTNTHSENSVMFNDFYETLSHTLVRLRQEDIESLGTEVKTKEAQKFCEFFNILNAIGYYNVNGRRINFWSGDKGQKKAAEMQSSLSDADIPAMCFMFLLGNLVENSAPALASLILNGTSAMFASQAKDVVELFVSNNKNNEQAGLTAGNNFWIAECPTLQRRIQSQAVKSIQVRFFEGGNKWSDAINFNDQEASKLIVVMRREAYAPPSRPDLHDKDPSRFFSASAAVDPRPTITLGKLRKIAKKFIKNTKEKIERKQKR